MSGTVDLTAVAKACGYSNAVSVETEEQLKLELSRAGQGLHMIEVKCALGARADLGRPTTSAEENKLAFMEHLSKN